MKELKKALFILSSSVLLVACGGAVENDTVSESTESASVEESMESVESMESETSSVEESSMESTSSEESSQEDDEYASLIEEAREKITAETGYEEGEEFIYVVDIVEEGEFVQIDVRENNMEVTSSRGLFRYDGETKTLYEQDILTGEFVEYPANN